MSHRSNEEGAIRRLAVDLVCGLAAGLCAGSFNFLIHILKPHKFEVLVLLRFMLTAVVAYLTVALILNKFWKEVLRRMLPTWIPIAFFGSLFFVILRLLPAAVEGWTGPTVTEPSLVKYLATELGAARSVVILLSLITFPITALIYHSGFILIVMKRWHSGTGPPLSILIKE